MKIGCHLSVAKGYVNMAKEAKKIKANTFAFFSRNPRGGSSKALDEIDISEFLKYDFETLVAHAPYILNPCSSTKKVREFAYLAMDEDLQKMEHIPGNYYNFHPGSHTGQGVEKGIELISELLNEILKPKQHTIVLLETMAGKGSEVGSRFEELAAIIDRVKLKDKIGICMDSCHVSDGGYDIINNLNGVVKELDKVIGIDYLKAMHLNDSLNPIGAHKDRHAKIGEGYLGLETFRKIVNHSELRELPFILETPNDLEGYAREIELLKNLCKTP